MLIIACVRVCVRVCVDSCGSSQACMRFMYVQAFTNVSLPFGSVSIVVCTYTTQCVLESSERYLLPTGYECTL